MRNLKSNIIKMYLFRFFSSFWLIVPVLIPYYKSAGLAATQVYLVQSIFLIAVLLLEVPSGYMADVIGRKKTIIIGTFFLSAGLASITGGLVGLASIKFPFFINIATGLIMIQIAFSLAEPARKIMKTAGGHVKNLLGIVAL